MNMKKHTVEKEDNRERGQSLIELAVSFTLLLLILGVTIDLGRMFYSYIAIREAAEEGALYGSMLKTLRDSLDPDPTDTNLPGVDAVKDAIRGRVKDSSGYTIDLTDWFELKDLPNSYIRVYFTSSPPNDTVKQAIYTGQSVTEKSIDDVCSGDSVSVFIKYDFMMFMPMTSAMTQHSPIEFKYIVTNRIITPLCN